MHNYYSSFLFEIYNFRSISFAFSSSLFVIFRRTKRLPLFDCRSVGIKHLSRGHTAPRCHRALSASERGALSRFGGPALGVPPPALTFMVGDRSMAADAVRWCAGAILSLPLPRSASHH